MAASALHHRVLGRSRHASRMAVGRLAFRASPVYTPATPLHSAINPPAASKDTCRRLFHDTAARRFFEAPEQALAVGIGIVSGWVIMGFLRRVLSSRRQAEDMLGSLPPASWILAAGPETKSEVAVAIEAGFNMARSQPQDRQHEAFREATFSVPYEVARLNKDAPDFKLEDMGPVPPIPEAWQKFADGLSESDPAFDPQNDARVFLYYPEGATRATTAFVAINAKFEITKDDQVNGVTSTDHLRLIKQALNSWTAWYLITEMEKPDVLERIEPGKLPVIFLFREKASACRFDPETKVFHNPASMGAILGFVEPPANHR